MSRKPLSRRDFLRVGVAGATGLAGLAALTQAQIGQAQQDGPTPTPPGYAPGHAQHGPGGPVMPNFNGEVNHAANGHCSMKADTDVGQSG